MLPASLQAIMRSFWGQFFAFSRLRLDEGIKVRLFCQGLRQWLIRSGHDLLIVLLEFVFYWDTG
jgi:hypothetical protein